MASTASPEANFDISGTFGIAYVGAMIAMALYGITALQSYLYYMYYPKDRPSLKLLVAVLWSLETLQVALMCYGMYSYLISNHANPEALEVGTWSLYSSFLCNLIISTIVQFFFCTKVYILSSSLWWLTILIVVAILAHLAFGLGSDSDQNVLILKDLIKLPSITLVAALPVAITAVITNVFIAISLCYFLHSVKSGFQGTNALLNQLIIYAINRCLLTSILAIVEVILFKTLPGSLYFLAVDFCIGRVYANSLLATLNTRQALRGRGYESDFSNPTPSSRSPPMPQFGGRGGAHSYRTDPVELSDLRATWPRSHIRTQGSAESVPGINNSELHRTHRSTKDVVDITVPVDIESEPEAQGLASGGREAPQEYVSFEP